MVFLFPCQANLLKGREIYYLQMETFGLELCFVLVLLTVAGIPASVPTYQWTDQETGEEVTCQQCPKGTFVAKHCTSTSKTECQPCPEQHYTSYWNYVEKCRFCNIICEDREQVKHECNATQNRVCECKPGYRPNPYYCIRDCSKLVDIDDPECDEEVIKFVLKQNFSSGSYRRLLRVVSEEEPGKKNVMRRKIRALLRQIKKKDPDHALLPQLLEFLKKTEMTQLERDLKERFMGQEDRYSQTNVQ